MTVWWRHSSLYFEYVTRYSAHHPCSINSYWPEFKCGFCKILPCCSHFYILACFSQKLASSIGIMLLCRSHYKVIHGLQTWGFAFWHQSSAISWVSLIQFNPATNYPELAQPTRLPLCPSPFCQPTALPSSQLQIQGLPHSLQVQGAAVNYYYFIVENANQEQMKRYIWAGLSDTLLSGQRVRWAEQSPVLLLHSF